MFPQWIRHYEKLLDFSGIVNGQFPFGSLVSDGTFLYGMTFEGGTNDSGVVFKIKPDGTGYSKLLDFTGTNGSNPTSTGSLIFDGTFLYGMTYRGGIGSGVIFKIKPDGTGYSKLLAFTGNNGSLPNGSLVSDGTLLYGMTTYGGANGVGTIFQIMPDGTGYSDLHDFEGTPDGRNPFGSLFSDGTFLYGTTTAGGTSNACLGGCGTLFKYHLAGMSVTENNAETNFEIYPNPFSASTTLHSNNSLKNASLTIYNSIGQQVKQINNISGQSIILQRDNLPSGLYFIRLMEVDKSIATDKLIITDN